MRWLFALLLLLSLQSYLSADSLSYSPDSRPQLVHKNSLNFGACSVPSATTVDIGLNCKPGQFVTITGTTTIASLGSTAPVGSYWFIYIPGSLQFTSSSTLNMSGLLNLATGSNVPFIVCSVVSTRGTWYCSNPLFNNSVFIGANGNIQTSQTIQTGNFTATGATITFSGMTSSGSALDYVCINATGGAENYETGACTASLEELKDISGPISSFGALIEILRLKPFWGKFKDSVTTTADHQVHPMFGAHQVESVDSRLAVYSIDKDTGKPILRSVHYQEMTALEAAAIKALLAIILLLIIWNAFLTLKIFRSR